MSTTTGADLACRALADHGVSVLFGHPGGAILPFYDALHRNADHLRHVLVRHEQAAAHAADGYARATGRVGVCVATSGPGATNLVTALATALMDSVPVVALTGQVARSVIGTFAFQETDTIGVTMGVTKHGFLMERAEDVEDVIAEAFRIATSGRPGPVVIDFPKDVQAASVSRSLSAAEPPRREGTARVVGAGRGMASEDEQLRSAVGQAAAWLTTARRPVLLVGRGVVLSRTTDTVRQLAERCDAPVATTLLGLDAFPATDRRSLGMPGMHGNERANRAIQEADLVLGLGARFDDRVIGDPARFAPRARIVQFDIDPCAAGRSLVPDLSIVADLGRSLPMLLEHTRVCSHPSWWEMLSDWNRAADPTPEPLSRQGPLGAREAIRGVARRISASGGLVASDVGQHQMWLAQELEDMAPGTHLSSGGLGTMGYALPAAIGAAVAHPNRPVWVVAGDGGFQMTLQELATVVQERLPLRIVVVDNGYLGMVRQWQERFYERRYSASRVSSPDFVALAQAYGIPAWQVDRSEQLAAALDLAATTEGPVLVRLVVEPEENVYPMVPTGAALDELVDGPAGVAG